MGEYGSHVHQNSTVKCRKGTDDNTLSSNLRFLALSALHCDFHMFRTSSGDVYVLRIT